MTARLSAALALGCLALALGGGASASTPALVAGSPVAAHGLAAVVIGPGGAPLAAASQLEAPPAGSSGPSSFAYPYDGSSLLLASTSTTVAASAADGTASATVEITDLSVFGGEITASEIRASASATGLAGDLSASQITNLIVLGQSVSEPAAGLHLQLADWGTLDALSEAATRGEGFAAPWRGSVTALSIHLDETHGGLPRGTTIRIGLADASARPPEPATTTTTGSIEPPAVTTEPSSGEPSAPPPEKAQSTTTAPDVPAARPGENAAAAKAGSARRKKQKKTSRLPVLSTIPDVTPKLTAGGYVFPIYGPSGYGDTFGAPRGDVSGGWHHGDDIFAPLGAPILAVTAGTVYSVGWNDVGGYRLWLRDRGGNEFYYAHLSAYTTLAVDGRHVRAGEVLGFVGNTGDAQGTPFHLHFEVHPVSLLFLGYDGAVNPTRYLDAWKRLEDVRILPAVPFATPGGAEASSAPAPGAILLRSADISTANGLDPGSLARAMNAAPIDVTRPRVTELPVPLPVLDRA